MFKKYYYLIPIIEKNISYEGNQLFCILKMIDIDLIAYEEKRINFIHSNKYNSRQEKTDYYNKILMDTRCVYDKHNLPVNIIAYGKGPIVHEIFTKKELVSDTMDALTTKIISPIDKDKYLKINDLYEKQISNYFELIRLKKMEALMTGEIIDFNNAKKLVKNTKEIIWKN